MPPKLLRRGHVGRATKAHRGSRGEGGALLPPHGGDFRCDFPRGQQANLAELWRGTAPYPHRFSSSPRNGLETTRVKFRLIRTVLPKGRIPPSRLPGDCDRDGQPAFSRISACRGSGSFTSRNPGRAETARRRAPPVPLLAGRKTLAVEVVGGRIHAAVRKRRRQRTGAREKVP